MFHTTSFYNSKISIPNRSASLFGKDNFSSRETDQSLNTIKNFKTIIEHFETIIL